MKFLKFVLTGVLLLSVVLPATAREVVGKVGDLISWDDGHTVISITNGPVNGCGSQYYYSLGVKGKDIKAETMLTIALSAYVTKQSVHISTSDGNCQGGQEKVVAIQLLPN